MKKVYLESPRTEVMINIHMEHTICFSGGFGDPKGDTIDYDH